MTLTVVEIPAVRSRQERTDAPHPLPPSQRGLAAANPEPASVAVTLRLPPMVIFQPAESPISPPELEGFKFAATLGGKPASGLTYLYERKHGIGAGREKWVVKYLRLKRPDNLDNLRPLLAAYFGVQHAMLHHPCAYSLLPGTSPTHLILCFPHLKGVDLARSPLLDLAGIHDVMSGALGVLTALHQQSLAHGHLCAENIFLEAAGQIVLADSGMNGIRSLIGAELTGSIPSASNDLIALGICRTYLLKENTKLFEQKTASRF
jgi:hypothetical protein